RGLARPPGPLRPAAGFRQPDLQHPGGAGVHRRDALLLRRELSNRKLAERNARPSDLSACLRVAADRAVERAEELRVVVGSGGHRGGRGPGAPGGMTCYRIVRVRPSPAPKVAVAWIVGARRG